MLQPLAGGRRKSRRAGVVQSQTRLLHYLLDAYRAGRERGITKVSRFHDVGLG